MIINSPTKDHIIPNPMVELTNMLTYFVMFLNLNWRPVKSSFPQISISNKSANIFNNS